MEKVLLKEKYPVWKLEIEKSKLNRTLDEIVNYFVEKNWERSYSKINLSFWSLTTYKKF